MKEIDVTALGELLIDFTPAGKSAQGNVLFEQNPGGAPANVLAAVVKQGGEGALISAVGSDGFGRYLAGVIESVGICADGLQVVEEAATTLAFVTLDETGNRSFHFCRKPGADQKIKKEKLALSLIDSCKIFHFGSLSLSDEPSRSAALYAAEYAKKQGKLVSYDPNWRPPLWESEEAGIAGMKLGLPLTDVLKLSEEELTLLAGEGSLEEATGRMAEQYRNLKLIIVTLGPDGCFYRCCGKTGCVPTYDTRVVDTTGAGDSFWGALLLRLSRCPACLDGDGESLKDALDYANASGSLCAAGRGAIPSVPTVAQIADARKTIPHIAR